MERFTGTHIIVIDEVFTKDVKTIMNIVKIVSQDLFIVPVNNFRFLSFFSKSETWYQGQCSKVQAASVIQLLGV